MENASKALIIAGAILLSILIIALGIFIFNAAKGAVNTETLDTTSLQAFNGPFEQYEGKQTGINVKTLISNVISSNGKSSRKVKVTWANRGHSSKLDLGIPGYNVAANSTANLNLTTNVTLISALRTRITNTTTYYVSFNYSSGAVSEVIISRKQ